MGNGAGVRDWNGCLPVEESTGDMCGNGALREGGMVNYVLGLPVCLSRAISTQSV